MVVVRLVPGVSGFGLCWLCLLIVLLRVCLPLVVIGFRQLFGFRLGLLVLAGCFAVVVVCWFGVVLLLACWFAYVLGVC